MSWLSVLKVVLGDVKGKLSVVITFILFSSLFTCFIYHFSIDAFSAVVYGVFLSILCTSVVWGVWIVFFGDWWSDVLDRASDEEENKSGGK